MPQLVYVAAYYLAEYVGSYLLYAAIVYSAYRYQTSSQNRKARNAFNSAQKDRFASVSLVDAPRSRIYGRVRNVDGILFKGTYGDKKQFLQLVVALAAHEVDAIESVYFNDKLLTLDGSGYITTGQWATSDISAFTKDMLLDASGNAIFTPDGAYWGSGPTRTPVGASVSVYVTKANGDHVAVPYTTGTGGYIAVGAGPAYAGFTATIVFQAANVSVADVSKARVQKFTGAPGQDLSAYLAPNFPSLITSAKHRFEGIACLLVTLEFAEDAYPTGVPQISAVVRGAKVLDPRTSVTAWTENPSLIARDWALYAQGGGAASDELDGASFTVAANACDVSHSFTTRNGDGATFTSTLPMYTCGIALDTTADASENFGAIIESMAGQWTWSGGRLRVRAGAYASPVASITESWCSGQGDIEIIGTLPRADRVNVITPVIYDAGASYVRTPLARVPADAYIAIDGQELPRELPFEGITDVVHASHVCGVIMRESRQALTVKLPCKFLAYTLEVFDVVSVTLPRFGWAAKAFEVMATEMTMTGGVVLTLKETDASVFDPDAEFTTQDPAPNTALPDPFTVPQLSITSLASGTAQLLKQADGTIVTRLLVTWAAIQDEAVRNGGAVEVTARRIGTTEAITETVFGTETQAYIRGVKDGTAYAVTITARNKLVRGLPSVMLSHIVLGKSEAPAAVAGLAAAVIPGALRISWTPSTEVDYAKTLLRYGASWAAGTPLKLDGPASSYDWLWPAPGSYTVWAAHVDTSGNVGAPVSVGPVAVTAAALAPANSALSIKLNVQDFAGGVNYSEAYLHGRDSSGAPVDAPGTILVNGVSTAVPNGQLNTNFGPVAGYIVWDSAGATFSALGSTFRHYVLARRYQGAWQYDDNNASTWTPFTPTSTMYIIGTLETGGVDTGNPGSAPGMVAASIWAAASTLNALEASADAAYALAAATSVVALAADGAMTILGNTATKTGGGSGWNSSVRSKDSFTGGAYVSWVNPSVGASLGFGLSSGPTVNASYETIDFWLYNDGTTLNIFNGSTFIVSFAGAVADGDVLAVTYDGSAVRYLCNGTILYTQTVSATAPLFLDSTFYTEGGVATNIQFGPLSSIAPALAAAATAQSAADGAATNATNALSTLATMRSNGYIDAAEKPALIKAWQAINDEQAGIESGGTTYGLTALRDAYTAAYNALVAYLVGLSPSWSDTTTDTPITPAVDQAAWAAYYSSRQALLNAIAAKAKDLADTAQAAADAAAAAASTAQGTANSAATNASSALSTLATMRSNGYIDASEKPALIKEWQAIADEHSGIDARAAAFGITTERTAWNTAYTALSTYLGGLTPSWNDTTTDTPITPATDNAKWADYYATRQVLLNKFAEISATLANWSGVGGRPFDYDQNTTPSGTITEGSSWRVPSTGRTYRYLSGAWQPYVGPGSVDTGEIAPDAATEITQDTYAFGGTGTGTGATTQRSFTYTPPVACKINFTAVIGASQVLPDSGNFLGWYVAAGGGSDVALGSCVSNSGNRQTFACVTSFSASAGVTLTFKLVSDRAFGNPAIGLYDSSMRVEAIKR